MSAHTFVTNQTGQHLVITIGWDGPLQGHFMTIFRASGSKVYSNLDDKRLKKSMGLTPDIYYFISVLTEYGIHLPQVLIDRVNNDRIENIGNCECSYTDKDL
jgi:hypothetical protein